MIFLSFDFYLTKTIPETRCAH